MPSEHVMAARCKEVQQKILLCQLDDDDFKHIAECPYCWAAFMNIGTDDSLSSKDAIQHKHRLLNQTNDPKNNGDHRMEQFQLLGSLPLTAYAKKVFLDYLSQLEQNNATPTARA
ncbi:MAG: hypothetical protein AAGJ35_10280, partial [Myxococcota bacterium]